MGKSTKITRDAVTLLINMILKKADDRRASEGKRLEADNARLKTSNKERIAKLRTQILTELIKKDAIKFCLNDDRITLTSSWGDERKMYNAVDSSKLKEYREALEIPALETTTLTHPILRQYLKPRYNHVVYVALKVDAPVINKAIEAIADSVLVNSGLDLSDKIQAILKDLGK